MGIITPIDSERESVVTSRWVIKEFNLLFLLSSENNQRKFSLSRSLSLAVNWPLRVWEILDLYCMVHCELKEFLSFLDLKLQRNLDLDKSWRVCHIFCSLLFLWPSTENWFWCCKERLLYSKRNFQANAIVSKVIINVFLFSWVRISRLSFAEGHRRFTCLHWQ